MSSRKTVQISYVGMPFYIARKRCKIWRKNFAKILGITDKELSRFEHGNDVIDGKILRQLFEIAIKHKIKNQT